MSSLVYSDGNSKEVVNTTSETNIFSLPVGFSGHVRPFKLTMYGTIVENTAYSPTVTLKLKFNSTTMTSLQLVPAQGTPNFKAVFVAVPQSESKQQIAGEF